MEGLGTVEGLLAGLLLPLTIIIGIDYHSSPITMSLALPLIATKTNSIDFVS